MAITPAHTRGLAVLMVFFSGSAGSRIGEDGEAAVW
jgi:hypothetical protein